MLTQHPRGEGTALPDRAARRCTPRHPHTLLCTSPEPQNGKGARVKGRQPRVERARVKVPAWRELMNDNILPPTMQLLSPVPSKLNPSAAAWPGPPLRCSREGGTTGNCLPRPSLPFSDRTSILARTLREKRAGCERGASGVRAGCERGASRGGA